jgi:hypothetical protein
MPLIDVSEVVSDLSESKCVRVRQTGSYVHGAWVAAPDVQTTFWGCVRPIDGRTRDALPEGVRTLARWLLHTLVDIKTTVAGAGTYGDRVIFDGRTYVAISIDDSFNTHGQYTRVALTELEN